ncbi:carbonic anhydrase 2 isoform X1 [Musca domestica]|uniref:Carbonic anhydrase 2 isoform X1 n=1 Tax=Musca domestica TaxID=7370 RepID=A0A9J7CIG2_MUSDO|nr:carbonic anhydrase 2 isoform X1 [Musca domestica]
MVLVRRILYNILPLFLARPAAVRLPAASEWTYEGVLTWGSKFPKCNGARQSPIHLQTSKSYFPPLAPITFTNYNVPLAGNLVVKNNGHSIEMEIPPTTNGARPRISGAKLPGIFEAMGCHFHWGSRTSRGAEHVINGQRYDAELHIVHKNVRYATIAEAAANPDGLAVLGIMINIGRNVNRIYPGLNDIFNRLPNLINYQSSVPLGRQITLSQLLGDVNTNQFYTYEGSLTTPDCSEAVCWNVFPQPLYIPLAQMQKFWAIRDNKGAPMINNFRPVQAYNNRVIFARG